jgi:purine-binding chemotaxis protein CheW
MSSSNAYRVRAHSRQVESVYTLHNSSSPSLREWGRLARHSSYRTERENQDDMSSLRQSCYDRQAPKPCSFVVFTLGGQYALRLASVERVVRAAEITPLPQSPEIVLGVINAQGSILPVVNVRRRFRLPEREMEPGDRMILAVAARRRVALLVDAVTGVVERAEEDVIAAEAVVPHMEYVDGVTTLGDDILLIHDLDSFLSLDEERELDAALTTIQ